MDMHEHSASHTCPRCQRLTGEPFREVPVDPLGAEALAKAAVSVRVLVRCDICRHRWSVIVPKDAQEITPRRTA